MSAAMADDVHLKNGKILVGEVTEETDTYLKIKLKVGEATIKMSDVESVEKKELPAGFFAEEKVPPEKKEAAEALGQKAKGEKNKKEKPEKPQPPYNTIVVAKYSVENSKDVIDVKGTTKLPDKTLIYVFFKKARNLILARKPFFKIFRLFSKSIVLFLYARFIYNQYLFLSYAFPYSVKFFIFGNKT